MPPRRQAASQSTGAEPKIRVAKSQLDGEIERRLGLGQELLDRAFPNPLTIENVRVLDGDFHTWDEYNERLLRNRFTTPKVADEYKRMTVGAFGELPVDRELYFTREAIRAQMRKLVSIQQQLEL